MVDPLVVVKTLNFVVVGRRVVVEYGGVSVVSIFFSQILSFDYWKMTKMNRKLILSRDVHWMKNVSTDKLSRQEE